MNFKELKAIGDKYEAEAIKKICLKCKVSVIERQTEQNYKTIHYDFKTSDGITYEIKADIASKKTNNFFIEYMGYNKPSGLAITTAEKHVLISPDIFYLMTTKNLKKLIKTNKYKVLGTKDGQTKGFIIPIDDVKNISEII